MRVPADVSELTENWLADAFVSNGVMSESASLRSLQRTGRIGDGMVGTIERFEALYAGPEPHGPSSFVAKFPSPDREVREFLRPTRIFEREALFYRDVAPTLPVRTPACFYAGVDVEANNFLMLLEDMTAWNVGDDIAGATGMQAIAAVREMAILHAATWETQQLRGLQWLPGVVPAPEKIWQRAFARFEEIFGSSIAVDLRSPLGESFSAHQGRLYEMCDRMPAALHHNDFRLDNLMFDQSGAVCVLDWQATDRGPGVLDLAFFVGVGMNADDRQQSIHDLLELYLDTLSEGGVTGYSDDSLRKDLQVGLLLAWPRLVVPAGTIADFSEERPIEVFRRMVDRLQAAILEHDCLELLT